MSATNGTVAVAEVKAGRPKKEKGPKKAKVAVYNITATDDGYNIEVMVGKFRVLRHMVATEAEAREFAWENIKDNGAATVVFKRA